MNEERDEVAKYHYCPNCNYRWNHGLSGAHSCSEYLIIQKEEILNELINMYEMFWGTDESPGQEKASKSALDVIRKYKQNY